jgi:hypothetical protein
MGGNGSATGGCRQQFNARYLTVTPSAAGRLPPPLRSVSSRLLDFYDECVDNGGWATVLYDTRDGLEKLTIIRRIQPTPAPTIAAPPATRKPGRQASARRRERDRRRREAWAERRTHRSQSSLPIPEADEISATAEPATSGQAAPSANTLPSPTAPPTPPQPASPSPPLRKSPQQSSPSPAPSPQPAPPPRKRAKTVSEVTRSSSRATVLAKKQQIPQLNGCLSPPNSPPQPASRPLAPTALADSPPLPVQQPISSLPVPDTTALADLPPVPPQQPISAAQQPISSLPVLDATAPAPSLSSLPPSSPAGQPTPAPTTPPDEPQSTSTHASATPAVAPVESSTPPSPGYTLVMIWCPSCKTNLIDNRDFECYPCQDRRFYYSVDYEDE